MARTASRLAGAAALLLLLGGCGGGPSRTGEAPAPAASVLPAGKVFILGLDGADWEILDRLAAAGKLPNLARLKREGASGVLLSEQPLLSPVVWTTIATGRPPTEHGIVGFLTARNGVTEPVRSDERKVRAFWNVASDLHVKVGVVGWYASWPAETVDGYLVTDRVGSHQIAGSAGRVRNGLVYPASLLPEIESLRDRVDRDVDERAAGRFFVAGGGGGASVRIKEDSLETFVGILRTTELYRRLVPILLDRFDPAISAVYFEGTDAVGHLFAEYEPPPLPGVDPETARHLGEAWDRYYQYVDEIVGEYVARIDPKTTTLVVVSDHGFKTGERRPLTPAVTVYANQAPIWHRPEGVLLLWGRGIRQGTSLPRASVYDVLPTVFRLAGLPLAETLEGRPVDAALTPDLLAKAVRTVPDYEAAGRREMPAATAEEGADEQMAKLRALGYVGGSPGEDASKAVGGAASGQEAVPLNRYNEAVILLNHGKREDALREFRELQRVAPSFPLGFLGEGLVRLQEGNPVAAIPPLEKAVALDSRVGEAYADLGEAYLGAGRKEDGIRALSHALSLDPASGRTALVLAEAQLDRRNLAEAKRLFGVARKFAESPRDRASGCVGLAILAEQDRRFDEADSLYREALADLPDLPVALERWANLDLYLGHADRAVDLLARLVAKTNSHPRSLMLYGKALVYAGRKREAREVLERSLALDPRQTEARQLLEGLDRKPS